MDMFCYQCEHAAQGQGCSVKGVCGKDPSVAALQDLLLHATIGISQFAHRARQGGVTDPAVDRFVVEALFTTITNVNFDGARLESLLVEAARMRDAIRQACQKAGLDTSDLTGPALWHPSAGLNGLVAQGLRTGILQRKTAQDENLTALQELLTYGVKGMAAYVHHATVFGRENADVYAFIHEALDALSRKDLEVNDLLGLNMKCGQVNLDVMALLDSAHTDRYGHPEPTAVRVTPCKGKAILVSGHDLRDLEALLQQTEGTGVLVYTHGEMLTAHAYPGLKKYAHLAGNYGGAWQDQRAEFEAFPGAILMTTNCIQAPREGYAARIFTCGLVAWPGVTHVEDRDFAPVIAAARAMPGFDEDVAAQTITIGFGHHTVIGLAGTVLDAVKSGAIRHFFLIGGCDGAKPGRNYYTELAQAVPKDCVILTLACGKYRFNKLDFGDIGGIPRLLDVGQCNDAYSAIRIASALAEAAGCGVNDLPLSLVLSWYEQKAVCILLTLLHLGIRDIRLGPSVPAFLTPALLGVLNEKFGLRAITTPDADLDDILSPVSVG